MDPTDEKARVVVDDLKQFIAERVADMIYGIERMRLLSPEAVVRILAAQPEVAALVETTETAMRQWRGLSGELRKRTKGRTIEEAEDAEARVYRGADAALAPWRAAREGRSDG